MTDSKILQAILDRVSDLGEGFRRLEKKMDDGFKRLDERIDKLGMQIADLEDDAPTREEFEKLEEKVDKIQTQIASV